MSGSLMKAIQYKGYGGGATALEHMEIPVPSPAENELLVKIKAVSLNPVDWKIQSGLLRPLLPRKFPFIPATDIAGEVVKVGSSIKDFKSGDRVVSMLNFMKGGGLAEYAVAESNETANIPEGVSFENSASLPIAALTALQSIRDAAGVKLDGSGKTKNLLVTAASGGVGHFAVQIAKLSGAHVTATCGERNIGLVKDLGAEEVLDYRTPEGAALKSPSGLKYDAVIHCASRIPWSTFQPNLCPNGKVIDLTPGFGSFAQSFLKKLSFSKQQLVPFIVNKNVKDLSLMLDLVKEGKVRVIIDSKFPLENAEAAWAKSMEGHATGKIIVTIGD
eukprot:TRINITY_DN516_c0_g1_i2.p1 TRINITY_DN516_c0_g1~~TRINITY_DN516_c0_g1_i2.p1  ORF type:complete len:332 (-),score=93.53 TRINITY_DN516_c0_g1_i2:435-1430(-)